MSTRDEQVDEAIAEYLAACDAGQPPTRAAFLAKYPDLADSLGSFIDDHQRMKQAAPSSVDDVTLNMPSAADDMTLSVGPEGAPRAKANQSPTITVPYFGDYELIHEIARGGMGVVYKAKQVSLNRIVALKMILAGQLASSADVQRFRQEAEAAASLDHPHILPIHEVGEYQGQQYFSMKLVEGGSLSDRVAALVTQPKQGVALVQQIAAAVHYAHQRGILHRDLKPANILLDADGTPYITDFGLAKKTGTEDSGLTRTGAIVGTPSYMAPEQARGEKGLTTAADTYALGAILYELLTGRAPFKGESIAQTLRLVEEQEPTPPHTLNPSCDPDLEAIALKCLEKQPNARYDTAGALADDLARWQRGEPVTARRATTLRRAIKWVQRNPVVAGLSVCLLLVMIVGTVTSMLYAAKAKDNEQRANNNAVAATDSAKQATASANEAKKLWYRGLYEQARALRMAHQPGWRSQSLQLLKTATTTRAELTDVSPDDRLPTLTDLRTEAIMALIQRDADLTRTVNVNSNVPVYFTSNGQRVFTVDYITHAPQIHLLVHDVSTGQEVTWLDTQAPHAQEFLKLLPNLQSLNHDGTEALVTTANLEAVQIRSTRTGALRVTLKDGNKGIIKRVDASRWVLSDDGQYVAGIRRNQDHAELLLWHVKKPEQPQIIARTPYPKDDPFGGELIRAGRYFGHLRFSPDSKTLSFASEDRQSYRLFDITRTPPVAMELKANGELLTAAWHPTQPLVATVCRVGSNQQLALWNVQTCQPQAIIDGDIETTTEGKLNLMSFSHDGRYLAFPNSAVTGVRIVGAFDGVERTRINDVCTFRLGHLAWLPNGELSTYGLMEQLKCWQLSEGQPQTVYPNLRPQRRPAFSADGRWLAVYAPSGQAIAKPDDRFVAYNLQSALQLDRIAVIDRQRRTAALMASTFTTPRVGELLFTPDSQQLVTFDPQHVVLRHPVNGTETLRRVLPKVRNGTAWTGTFHLADRRLVGIYEYANKDMSRAFGLWDIQADQPLDELSKVLAKGAPLLITSPEGHRALVPAMPEFNVLKGPAPAKPKNKLFELPTGRLLHEFVFETPFKQPYTTVRFMASQGQQTLSLTTDLDNVKMGMTGDNFFWAIHEIPSGKELFRTPVRAFAENACSFMNGGRWLVIGGDAGHVDVWDIARKEVLFRWQPNGGKKVGYLAADRHDIVTNAVNDDRLSVLHVDELLPQLQTLGLGWESTQAK